MCLLVIICLFWSNSHLRLLPIFFFFRLGFVLTVVIELYEPLVYFGNYALVDCIVAKCILNSC